VSAHANAATVAKYLRNVLKRNNIDNKGGPIVSVVNCVVAEEEDDGDGVWLNAFWDGKQMVYGQDAYDDGLRSLASNPDVVAHELFHGVTSNTARLEYVFETGALNESYSDIFGLLISNANNRDIGSWDWLMGDGLSSDVKAYRSFANPSDRRLDKPQPKHMRKYRHTLDDKGGVHHNSGIHNYAAYKIMTAKDGRGRYLFKPRELAAMFYIALTQHLARQSTFSASRRAVLLATRSYFRRLAKSKRPRGEFNKRVRAVELAFAAAGIY
jgi:Zn-dependent metalloprotease